MNKIMLLASAVFMVFCTWGLAAQAEGTGGLSSLRGTQELNQEDKVPVHKQWRPDRKPIPRDYVQQPPLVPHTIEGYQINLRQNKCLTCHSWARYKETGATKISLTHFRDRFGNEMSNVSPQRYFCTQCHAPQKDAVPLVDNTFEPVGALRH